MDNKLVNVEFGVIGKEEFAKVFNAFVAPFPSLAVDAGDVYDWLTGDEWTAGDKVAYALDEASVDGQWPGRVYKIYHQEVGCDARPIEAIVEPYVGDRRLVIHLPVPETGEMYVKCDYSARPSTTAAREVIALAEASLRWRENGVSAPRLWNHPVWV